jgi:hypothetical protein
MDGVPLIPVATTGPLLVDKASLAKALDVSPRTNWRSAGVIPSLQFGNRFVRFDLAEVHAALEKRFKVHVKGKKAA